MILVVAGKGRYWHPAVVARVRDVYGIPAPRTAAVGEGEVSIAQAAAHLRVAPKAVNNWIRKGQLPARRGAAGRWCIPGDEDIQALYRQQSPTRSASDERDPLKADRCRPAV